MSGPTQAAAVPVAVERFVKQLVITHKAVALYPPASSIPRENAADAVALLEALLVERPEMRLGVTKDALVHGGLPVFAGQAAFVAFAQELYNRTVSEVRFHAGVTAEGLVAFLGAMRVPLGELASTGGMSARLWDAGVDAITVLEAVTTVIDQGELADAEDEGAPWPPPASRIDELLAELGAGIARDRRTLVRVVLDAEVTAAYLGEAFARHEGDPLAAAREIDIVGLARAADRHAGDSRAEALQALADAVRALDLADRRALIAGRLLPEARTDESVAALVRQMGVDAVCRSLVEGLGESDVSSDALARALRNLALISMAGRDEILNSSGAAMRAAGFSETAVDAVLEQVAPSRLVEREHAGEARAEAAVSSIMQLVDLAPSVTGRADEDPALAALRDEARAGITDGDVMGALVTVATAETDEAGFAQSMDGLEAGLELLIERGEFAVAADAAEALLAAAEQAEGERSERLVAAVGRLAGAAEMRSVHEALRIYRKGSPEHEACLRLLAALGTLAIDPLLEVLADEPDMAVRKSLVELISTIADRHIDEVGERVTDGRWYVVRNVVSILGATRRAEIVPFLGRTIRHADGRVRRETIRALAGVPAALAETMLAAALEDDDPQNVQLAARYLGSRRSHAALPALERVARGEGRGSREHGPRVEAIEALGTIGDPAALATLRTLAGRKRLLGGGRGKSVSAAAEAAIEAISVAGKEQR